MKRKRWERKVVRRKEKWKKGSRVIDINTDPQPQFSCAVGVSHDQSPSREPERQSTCTCFLRNLRFRQILPSVRAFSPRDHWPLPSLLPLQSPISAGRTSHWLQLPSMLFTNRHFKRKKALSFWALHHRELRTLKATVERGTSWPLLSTNVVSPFLTLSTANSKSFDDQEERLDVFCSRSGFCKANLRQGDAVGGVRTRFRPEEEKEGCASERIRFADVKRAVLKLPDFSAYSDVNRLPRC